VLVSLFYSENLEFESD